MADLASTRVFGKLTVMHEAIVKANAEIVGDITASKFIGDGSQLTSLPWGQLTGVPSTFAPSSHTHQWGQVSGAPATATRWPAWGEVTGKPVQATRWPSWSEVSSKPSTFTPSAHTHNLSQITDAGSVASLSTTGSTTAFLRGDGTWATPPNTNTTYSEITTAEIDAGTASTLRTISGRRMKYALDKKANTTTQVVAGTGLTGGGNLSANRTLSVKYGTAAGTAAQGNDSRLSNSREWNASTVSQAEAQAGTATTARKWTSQRVRQAITAWFNGISGALGRTILTRTTTAQVRADIGLGTASTRDVGESAGNVMEVGSFGLGGQGATFDYSNDNSNSLGGGFFIDGNHSTIVSRRSAQTGVEFSGEYREDRFYARRFRVSDGGWQPRFELYHTGNMPTTATRWPTFAEVTGKPTNYPTNWATVSNKPIVQTVGTSTTNLMSQKAVTDALGAFSHTVMVSNAILDNVDNSITATGIISELDLEVGDVIELDNDDLKSGYLKPLGQAVGRFEQFATNGDDVYVVSFDHRAIMKQTNSGGLFEKIGGVPTHQWNGICFIGNQMYAAAYGGRVYSIDEATGTADIVSPTNRNWRDLTTDGTYIYGCLNNSGRIIKVDPITKTEESDAFPTSPHGQVYGLVYSPIDNSLYIGASGNGSPIRKLVNMTGTWIEVSTEKRPWGSASYYNGKVYFSDHVGQVWVENDAGDDFELFSTKPADSPNGRGGNILVNNMLYKSQHGGDIYTTPIIKKDLFTVESIVSANKIIVNGAHAFGAGSKSLWSQTLNAAKFERIAKWYNAPNGLGQAWVDVSSNRANLTNYTNTTGRAIAVYLRFTASGSATIDNAVLVDGIPVGFASSSDAGMSNFILVPRGSVYIVDTTRGVETWSELR